MHQDLLDLRDLWKVDLALDQATQEILRLEKQVEHCSLGVVAAQAQVRTMETEQTAQSEAQSQLEKRLEAYLVRRDRAKRAMDEGHVADYHAAQRQYQQCADIVDEVETELLESMEKMEELGADVAGQRMRCAEAEGTLNHAKAEQSKKTPQLQAEIDGLQPVRKTKWSQVNSLHYGRYEGLRSKRKSVLTSIVQSQCAACHMTVSSQVINEVRAQKRVHTCRSCSRFFFDTREAPAATDG